MIGTLVNTGAVVIGGAIGLTAGTRLPERIKTILMQALGLSVLAVGLRMALEAQHALLAIACLLLGGITGELLRIEQRLEGLAETLRQLLRSDSSRFVEGFVTATLLYLTGAMTIVGSIRDGTVGDSSILLLKALLDGVASVALASSLGVGVIFSALPVLVVQGGITLLAGQLAFLSQPAVLDAVNATGGLLILGIGVNLLDLGRIRVGNLLPAVLYAIIGGLLFPLISGKLIIQPNLWKDFTMNRRLFTLLTVVLLTLAVWLPSPARAQSANQQLAAGSVLETIKKRGAIKVGMSTFIPWAMRDKSGALVGYEIDVAKRLAEDLGVKAEFAPTAWDGIIPALLAGKFDLIIGGLSITPERNLTVNFTLPYAHSGTHLVANRKLADGFKSLDDFNQPTVTLAVRRGATPATAAKRLMPKATLRQFDEDALALQEVLNGKAHAFVTSAPTPAFEAIKHPETLFLPIPEPFMQGMEGFALRKGDPDALNFFNNWILLRQQDGWLKERHDYWFKTRDWASQVVE